MFLVALLSVPLIVQVVSAVNGPWADHLHIVNYGSDYKEQQALSTGEIDITDWPYSKLFIDDFAKRPGEITLRDYAEYGSFEIDIYGQRWPTGVGDDPADSLTLDPKTGTYKHYIDESGEWDMRAWMFRLAIAHLQDRDYIKTEILKGYAYPMYTFVPKPGEGWIDQYNLSVSSYNVGGVYGMPTVTIPSCWVTYNKAKAIELLDAAGFVLDGDGIRNDPRYGGNLQPIIFYIRLDHPAREAMGLKMAKELEDLGIPVDARDVEKTVCFKSVMVEYNYHLTLEDTHLVRIRRIRCSDCSTQASIGDTQPARQYWECLVLVGAAVTKASAMRCTTSIVPSATLERFIPRSWRVVKRLHS